MIIDLIKFKAAGTKEAPAANLVKEFVEESLPEGTDKEIADLIVRTVTPFVHSHAEDLIDCFIESLETLPQINGNISIEAIRGLVTRFEGLKGKL